MLDNDSLLQIFRCYRLKDENNWNIQLTWRKLAHVCRRWRLLVSDSWSHLDMHLLLTNDSPSIYTLSHLPPLPLAINFLDRTRTMTRKDEDNLHLGLQQHDRVSQVAFRAPSLSLRMWFELMNKLFPRLRDLSLLSTNTEEMGLVLPETFQAPDLRHLSLHGIGLPKRLSLLSSMIALSALSLTHIGEPCYFPPGHLITQLQGLPHLEELSIGFAIPIPLPSNERELIPAPVPPMTLTLPSLRRLTFRGVGVYLDNLVAQINTPLLERLGLTLFFELAYTLVNLAKFIHRTEAFGCLFAQVIFNKDGACIDVGHPQRVIGRLSLRVNCESLDWQIDSATQVCSALREIVSVVEELTLDLDVDGMPSDWKNTLDNELWHEFLLPFIGVQKLRVGSSLTLELSQALQLVAEGLVLDLLPELQELEAQLEINHVKKKKAFSAFVKARESVGRPILLTISAIPRPRPKVPRPNPRPNPRPEGVGPSLTLEHSQASQSVVGGLDLDLMRQELQEMKVQVEIKYAEYKKALSASAKAVESMDRRLSLALSAIPRPRPKVLRPNPRSNPRPEVLPTLWSHYYDNLRSLPSRWLDASFPSPHYDPASYLSDDPLHASPPKLPSGALFGNLARNRRISATGNELTVRRAGNDEEAPPKKEYRRNENKRRLRENPQRRANENWRYRQLSGASGINARISQPGRRIAF